MGGCRPLYLSSALAQAAPTTLPTAWPAPQSMFSEPSMTSSPLYAILSYTPTAIHIAGILSHLPPRLTLPGFFPTFHSDSHCRHSFPPPTVTHIAVILSHLPLQLRLPRFFPTSHCDSHCRDSFPPPTATQVARTISLTFFLPLHTRVGTQRRHRRDINQFPLKPQEGLLLLGIDKLLNFVVSEWLQDIKKNQLPSLLGGVGPMHAVVQLC
uniref:Autophagy-related protein 2 n=1 Tax=Timema cristinae TaxID=61476 RepID=A0A7R9D708_TIMCR|nr:unnamed protein product [Timema cristinae]